MSAVLRKLDFAEWERVMEKKTRPLLLQEARL